MGGFDISSKLSKETIYLKCQSPFSGKIEEYFKMSSAEVFTQHAERYNYFRRAIYGTYADSELNIHVV